MLHMCTAFAGRVRAPYHPPLNPPPQNTPDRVAARISGACMHLIPIAVKPVTFARGRQNRVHARSRRTQRYGSSTTTTTALVITRMPINPHHHRHVCACASIRSTRVLRSSSARSKRATHAQEYVCVQGAMDAADYYRN